MYTISYNKIAIEFAALNLLVLVFLSQASFSFQALCFLTASINVLVWVVFIVKKRTYKIQVNQNSLVLYTFSFTERWQEYRISYSDLEATYRKELIGKGIRQKKIRLYERGGLCTILAPSFTGWQHHTLDDLIADLEEKKVAVQNEEE